RRRLRLAAREGLDRSGPALQPASPAARLSGGQPQTVRQLFSSKRKMRGLFPAIVIIPVVLAVLGGSAISAQDKYTVQVPGGVAFSEFRGYEDWQTIAVSQTGDLIAVILGNPQIIDAYRSGVPGNGKPFPDGSKMAKIHWNAKKSAEAPAPTLVPDTLHDV